MEVLYGSTPRLLGIDGEAKAGKSLGNAIFLTNDTETVNKINKNIHMKLTQKPAL